MLYVLSFDGCFVGQSTGPLTGLAKLYLVCKLIYKSNWRSYLAAPL